MTYFVYWSVLSKESFNDEVDFIFRKWNLEEVLKFIKLVEMAIERLSIHPEIGRYRKEKEIYSFVISKQTTLFYRINKFQNQIELILFWNNSKNPVDLIKLL
ncbi:type II toxin-antitoxin system RelE/ParE family toxin [Flavobacterium aquiphilum]|uniref:type II toxin-antitoxin system RelE/ParE family toxin n=1 Tax=Flavobacterium aquiphilum TaxID=3003261 RepID=UPI00248078FF|nr:type II toxin-antitoxin system RelE/ParE family toxin [Flavobacterium aquiphilum]